MPAPLPTPTPPAAPQPDVAPAPSPAPPPRTGRIDERAPEPVFTPFSLTVGDGFKFGCGLTMAITIALLIGLLVLSVVFLAASLVGAPLPVGR